MIKLRVRKGDNVIVISGDDKGKIGRILEVIPSKRKIIVSGINLVVKHSKPSQKGSGGIINKELPIHISNISHVDPKSKKCTKVCFKFLENGTKVRIAKKSGEIIIEKD